VAADTEDPVALAEELIELAAQVAAIRDLESVLNLVMTTARRLTRAEAGRILVIDRANRQIHCVLGQNEARPDAASLPGAIPVFTEGDSYNLRDPNVYALVTGQIVNLDWARASGVFDLAKSFETESRFGFPVRAIVSVPFSTPEGVSLGVLQLLNPRLSDGGAIGALPKHREKLVVSFAAHAAVAITNARLFDQNRLLIRQLDRRASELQAENARLKQREQRFAVAGPIGSSAPIRAALELVQRAARTRVAVLLLGETGTGKEVFARTIHRESDRADRPFVAQNCAALPEALLESELFGHRKGAFTGAVADKKGLVQEAEGGTLFLDEIGDMPLALQAKLLRLLEEGSVRRVGASRPETVNIRIIAATNAELGERIAAGHFRKDLYYRLSVFPIGLPPLRERPSDIPLLVDHFLVHMAETHGRTIPALTAEALEALTRWHWPGNVRELRNVVERALLLADEGQRIGTAHLPREIAAASGAVRVETTKPGDDADLKGLMRRYEARVIEAKLKEAGWNQSRAARLLRISRRSLIDKLQRYDIRTPRSPQ
jgi:sigma-54-dependent transcriptional regulator